MSSSPDFYRDKQRWALPMQLWFLTARHKQLSTELADARAVVADYTFAKDQIFAGMCSKSETVGYTTASPPGLRIVRRPDLVVYWMPTIRSCSIGSRGVAGLTNGRSRPNTWNRYARPTRGISQRNRTEAPSHQHDQARSSVSRADERALRFNSECCLRVNPVGKYLSLRTDNRMWLAKHPNRTAAKLIL